MPNKTLSADQMTLGELLEAVPPGPYLRSVGNAVDSQRRRLCLALGLHDANETAELITRLLNFTYAGGFAYLNLQRQGGILNNMEQKALEDAFTLLNCSSIASDR
jgi:hypothetical protein